MQYYYIEELNFISNVDAFEAIHFLQEDNFLHQQNLYANGEINVHLMGWLSKVLTNQYLLDLYDAI